MVFQTRSAISRGPTLGVQPPIRAERWVVGQENVETPAYSGPAFVVDEWVTGLQSDPETGELIVPSLEDTDGDGVPQRGLPTARYWVAPGVGVVRYEYEFVDLGPPPAFTLRAFILERYSLPTVGQ
ncbi:MAG: hypothetical protein KatS3mg115_2393 [Candidatus Poribacteria bacterium]|nr:MAG: hypothetical protein KatS3mg115_2393 [Candidatus Poribacteria bacterium]